MLRVGLLAWGDRYPYKTADGPDSQSGPAVFLSELAKVVSSCSLSAVRQADFQIHVLSVVHKFFGQTLVVQLVLSFVYYL